MRSKIKVLFAQYIWNTLPGALQITISHIYAQLYKTRFSRLFITPFCKMHSLSESYLLQFISPTTNSRNYTHFQDFFTRKFVNPPNPKSKFIWPCEGYVCQQGYISELPVVRVKGESRTIDTVFTQESGALPGDYFFTNVFLHNQNYHRIHSPISGIIRRIEKIPGDLSILRPWFYKKDEISKPALRNERVNVDIVDELGRRWFLSIVGGMAVGTIELLEKTKLNQFVQVGEELALFYLGSTCCLASPIELSIQPYLKKVCVGEDLPVKVSPRLTISDPSPSL